MKRRPIVSVDEPAAQILSRKREAQLDADSAMMKTAPEGLDIEPQKTNPLEHAYPHMEAIQAELEQLVEVSRRIYNQIEQIKTTGEVGQFLDTRLKTDPEMWEAKEKEIASIKNKLLTSMPVLG